MPVKRLFLLLLVTYLFIIVTFMAGCTSEYEINIQADPEEAGEISGEGTYEGTYEEGEEVTVKAEHKDGYEFEKWEKDGEEIKEESFEFEIEEDTEVVANFHEILVPDNAII